MRQVFALIICCFLITSSIAQSNCSNALSLTPGNQQCGDSNGFTGDFPGDGSSPINPCSANHNDDEYWFTYSPGAQVDEVELTLSSISTFFTGIFVFDNCPSNSPSCIASDVNLVSTADIVISFPVTSGTDYKIVIATFGPPNGTTFCLDAIIVESPPSNDILCNAEALVVDANSTDGSNLFSTKEALEPFGDCWTGGGEIHSVWYSFIAPNTGSARVSTNYPNTSLHDTHISIYALGTCTDLTSLNEIGCDEDSGTAAPDGNTSIADVYGMTAGETYYVQVDGKQNNVGDFKIKVSQLAPENDDCSDSKLLAEDNYGGGSLINEYFAAATPSGYGSEVCDNNSTPSPNDLWYKVNTGPGGGDLTILAEPGPNSDIVLGIYSGCFTQLFEFCADQGNNGEPETITFNTDLVGSKEASSTRTGYYYIRVYEKIVSGEPFELAASGEALPVVLGSFDVSTEKRGNLVKWSTLSEINSDYIEVQSSPNGSTKWEPIGKVQTKGESLSKLYYELFDNNPYEVTYYRLNAVDKDGKAEFSHSINVKREDKLGRMSLSPNPTSSSISLQTVSTSEMTGTIIIHDMTGKVVKNETVSLRNGLNTFSINLDNLNTGIYLFSLRTEKGMQVEKIVKQ